MIDGLCEELPALQAGATDSLALSQTERQVVFGQLQQTLLDSLHTSACP